MRQIATDWHHVMATHHLRFTESITPRDVCIAGDKTAVSRVLNILLDNAVKYTPSAGNIELALETKNGNAVIAVRDTGIGISNEDQSRIFERFYRADKARSRELEVPALAWPLPNGS